MDFFKVKSPDEVLELLGRFPPVGREDVPLDEAFGRVLFEAVLAPEDLPGFARSTVDGYAVMARDTFGASESLPGLLEVAGEVPMGQAPAMNIRKGQAIRISTGGMLPGGADGVVMIEHCALADERTLEVSRSIAPLENVIQPGDDFAAGARVLPSGHRLRPQDLGALAALGLSRVGVFRRPRVAVLSTGDEIVSAEQRPGPGQVRDVNRYTLCAFCRRLGAEPLWLGICPDEFEPLKALVDTGLKQADAVWLSGGSSVGTRDLALKVFRTLPEFELLVHGISVSPGKPTIIGRAEGKPVIGLPGHVASALVVAEIFMTRLLAALAGASDLMESPYRVVRARLGRNVASAAGREEYIRVRLQSGEDGLVAEPLFGKSGLISTLVVSDGLMKVNMNTEGRYAGEEVEVMIFSRVEGGVW